MGLNTAEEPHPMNTCWLHKTPHKKETSRIPPIPCVFSAGRRELTVEQIPEQVRALAEREADREGL